MREEVRLPFCFRQPYFFCSLDEIGNYKQYISFPQGYTFSILPFDYLVFTGKKLIISIIPCSTVRLFHRIKENKFFFGTYGKCRIVSGPILRHISHE